MHNTFLPAPLLANVFLLKHNNSTGSSFLIHYNGEKFLLSAKHLFPGLANASSIEFEFSRNKIWNKKSGIGYIHENPNVDVIAIKINEFEGLDGYNFADIGGVTAFSDSGFFVGFPLGISGEDLSNVNNAFPIPLIKGAIYSGFTDIGGISVELLDGHNNPGFSGGPVFFRSLTEGQQPVWKLLSIVSAYINQNNELVTPFGNLQYTTNSGIIISYGVRFIKEMLDNI